MELLCIGGDIHMNEMISVAMIVASIFDFLNPLNWIDWVVRLVLAVLTIIVAIALAFIVPKGKILTIIIGIVIAIYVLFYWGGII